MIEYVNNLSQKTKTLIPEAEIIAMFNGVLNNTASSNPPIFIGIGGGVAAGKNTLLRKLQADKSVPENIYIHDPDDVMVKLPSYQKYLAEHGAQEAQKIFDKPALEIAEAMLKYAIDNKKDIIYMRTFAAQNILEQLEQVKNAGYKLTEFHAVFADKDLIEQRLQERERQEQRSFPLNEAIERTEKFSANFLPCSDFFEKTYKWQNNDELKLTPTNNKCHSLQASDILKVRTTGLNK
jgi:predicted ABC-type ATPase